LGMAPRAREAAGCVMLVAARQRRRQDARRARDRRLRARRKAGRMTALVELDGFGLDWLFRVHALDPKALEVTDVRQVRGAVSGRRQCPHW
jgi:hypothetical protein